MKPPYGIFATIDGQVKFLRQASIRYPRANRAALESAKFYPGVFFAHFDGGGNPTGERHKPQKYSDAVNGRRLQIVGTHTGRMSSKQLIENLPKEEIERARRAKRRPSSLAGDDTPEDVL